MSGALRIIGICVGVAALVAVGLWQLNEEGELVPRNAEEVREELNRRSPADAEIAGIKTITAYCQYGSISMKQMEGCYFNVHLEEIEDRGTNAARWAREELDECLDDAGPYCGVGYRRKLEARIDERVAESDKADERLGELQEKYGSG